MLLPKNRKDNKLPKKLKHGVCETDFQRAFNLAYLNAFKNFFDYIPEGEMLQLVMETTLLIDATEEPISTGILKVENKNQDIALLWIRYRETVANKYANENWHKFLKESEKNIADARTS
jgi:hypothetical protein